MSVRSCHRDFEITGSSFTTVNVEVGRSAGFHRLLKTGTESGNHRWVQGSCYFHSVRRFLRGYSAVIDLWKCKNLVSLYGNTYKNSWKIGRKLKIFEYHNNVLRTGSWYVACMDRSVVFVFELQRNISAERILDGNFERCLSGFTNVDGKVGRLITANTSRLNTRSGDVDL